MLCDYKDIFGKTNEGIHSYKIFNVAIMDLLGTIIGAYVIHLFIPRYSFIFILIILLILGIVLHNLFCVHTTLNKLVGL